MKIIFNTQNINVFKLTPNRQEYKISPIILKNRVDEVSFGSKVGYKKAKNIYSAIGKSKRVCILVHKDIDADALSSGVLFLELMKRKFKNKDIQFVVNQEVPKFLSKIPYSSNIVQYKDLKNKKFDTVVLLDCDDRRVDCYDIFENANVKINIDHHKSSENNFEFDNELRLLNSDAVSTTQLIYDNLFVPFGYYPNMPMIECVMTGIVSDSGNLKRIADKEAFTKTMEHLDACSKVPLKFLIKNINNNFVALKQRSKELEVFFADTVSGKNVSEHITPSGKKISYIVVDKNLLDTYQIKDSEIDIKDMLSYITSLYKWKTDVVATIWQRENGEVRLSLRSNEVDLLSSVEKLGGGGHRFAAGASLDGSLENALEKFMEVIDSEI